MVPRSSPSTRAVPSRCCKLIGAWLHGTATTLMLVLPAPGLTSCSKCISHAEHKALELPRDFGHYHHPMKFHTTRNNRQLQKTKSAKARCGSRPRNSVFLGSTCIRRLTAAHNCLLKLSGYQMCSSVDIPTQRMLPSQSNLCSRTYPGAQRSPGCRRIRTRKS